MPHPLATQLAPIIDLEVGQLQSIVARWVVNEPDELERARYRTFGARLRGLKERIVARPQPPSDEEVEIAITAMLALAGRRERDRRA